MRHAKNPPCRRYGAQKETSAHVLRKCEVLVTLRHNYLGSFSSDPEDVRNMALESKWIFIKIQNCHELDFSSKGPKVPVQRPMFIGTQQGSNSLTHSWRLSRNVGNYHSTRHYVPADGRQYFNRRRNLKPQTHIYLCIYLFICKI